MNRRSAILIFLVLVLLAAGVWAAHRAAFDWGSLRAQLRSVALLPIVLGCAGIYAGFWFRALRWRVLMGPRRDVTTASLVAPQFIGFTIVALFGRLADLARPYLIARRVGVPVATQVAVYSVERIFDLAAAAILFSVTLAFAPASLPHHKDFVRAGVVSLAATITLAAVALAIRFYGEWLAAQARTRLSRWSQPLAENAALRILDFQRGLSTLRGGGEIAVALLYSLLLWLGIAEAYVQSAHTMTATPQLAALTFTQAMLMMATAMGGSMLQLPVLGWFTQIAFMAAAVHGFFGAPLEAATACAAITLFCTTLSIIPAGLVAARAGSISLRGAARQAEAA